MGLLDSEGGGLPMGYHLNGLVADIFTFKKDQDNWKTEKTVKSDCGSQQAVFFHEVVLWLLRTVGGR